MPYPLYLPLWNPSQIDCYLQEDYLPSSWWICNFFSSFSHPSLSESLLQDIQPCPTRAKWCLEEPECQAGESLVGFSDKLEKPQGKFMKPLRILGSFKHLSGDCSCLTEQSDILLRKSTDQFPWDPCPALSVQGLGSVAPRVPTCRICMPLHSHLPLPEKNTMKWLWPDYLVLQKSFLLGLRQQT